MDKVDLRLKKWFGASKVANPDGTPIRMFHGMPRREGLVRNLSPRTYEGEVIDGIYFSSNPEVADGYAVEFRASSKSGDFDDYDSTGSIYPVYLRIIDPIELDGSDEDQEEAFRYRGVKVGTHDGIIIWYGPGDCEAMVLYPSQIKSVWSKEFKDSPDMLERLAARVIKLCQK